MRLQCGKDGVVDEMSLAQLVEADLIQYVASHDLTDHNVEQDHVQARIAQLFTADRALNDVAAVAPTRFQRADTHSIGDRRIRANRGEQARKRPRILGSTESGHQSGQRQQVGPETGRTPWNFRVSPRRGQQPGFHIRRSRHRWRPCRNALGSTGVYATAGRRSHRARRGPCFPAARGSGRTRLSRESPNRSAR